MICNEFDVEQTVKEKKLKRNLDEVFFERGNKHARDKCKNIEKH